MYQEKKEGGKCSCGATFVKNPKTGKIFCEQKCWLKGQTSTQPNVQVEEKPDWDKIALGKVKHGVACAFIQANKPFNPAEMKQWVDWIMGEPF